MVKVAVIGGGAAGFFLAVNLKERLPESDVIIFEAAGRVLRKVKVSGGGRCNLTNSFEHVTDLSQVYPRGHRLMKRLFHSFSPQDAFRWFEAHGVALTVQLDGCVFPRSQQSQQVIDCLTHHARRLGVQVVTGRRIQGFDELHDFDYICVTTGGGRSLFFVGGDEPALCPSLFTFSIQDEALRALMGTVVEHTSVALAGTKLRADGPLLITHWGMSGPAILRLSSYAARHLHDCDYRATLSVNWLSMTEAAVRNTLTAECAAHPHRQLNTSCPFSLPLRLWQYIVGKSLHPSRSTQNTSRLLWEEVGGKLLNRLVNLLTNDSYQISGRAPFRDEFVTCGGVPLSSVHPNTLESRLRPHLYFAGEVLDIDGITGGFNFQCAWTTAYVVARSIADAAAGN